VIVRDAAGERTWELPAGTAARAPDRWCARDRVYLSYVRLQDVGIAGATFGVAADGALDWIPPEDAGCIDWAVFDLSLNFGSPLIMRFRLVRPLPGALLWVLEGDDGWRGRLYEVGPDGVARYVTPERWQADQDHFRAVWPNVLPVCQAQLEDFASRGLVELEPAR
jgi:hypothetical protein